MYGIQSEMSENQDLLEKVEVLNTGKLLIQKLQKKTTEDELRTYFTKFGLVVEAKLFKLGCPSKKIA